jgi:hypothetical protein
VAHHCRHSFFAYAEAEMVARSYKDSPRTHNDGEAVCFLWRFPSAGLEPGVPDVIRHTALRSSDFPLRVPKEHEKRPSGPAAYPMDYMRLPGSRRYVSGS